jgi:uncharacterized membrane protein
MFNLYPLFKFAHILLAIIAVGFNASYAIWLTRAARAPQHLSYVLRGIKFLDDRFANPSYGLLFITGLIMVLTTHIPLTTFWIAAALGLWFGLLVIGVGFYTPTLRKQIQVLEAQGADSPEFKQLSRHSTLVGMATMVPVLLILILMIFKPML